MVVDRVTALSGLLRPGEGHVLDSLCRTPHQPGVLPTVGQLLLNRCRQGPSLASEVTYAWCRLEQCEGHVPIAALAREAGCSQRHLERLFHQQMGVTPKRAARLFRARRAVRALIAGRSPAEVSYLCGYYDQAHLSGDCKALTGLTPRQLCSGTSGFLDGPDKGGGQLSRDPAQ
ncbi:helix-turn-helix domain-containing protein [Streptomyces klenkii]|uniref:helix-turn-helix domain-containing protein n=1 Tax=Streptomyces klenkii TaxID=1420899 RepID=UPI003417DED3